MEADVKHVGIVKDGVFHPNRPKLYATALKKMEGRMIYLTVHTFEPDKSLDQLGFYYGGIISATCMNSEAFGGWLKEEIDSFFQDQCPITNETITKTIYHYDALLQEQTEEIVNFVHRRRLSTLSKAEMNDYINWVIRWLAMEGIEVLDPNEYIAGKYKAVKKNAKAR